MKFSAGPRVITAFLLSLSVFLCSGIVRAQKGDAKGSKGVVIPSKPSPAPTKVIRETKFRDRIVKVTPTTGSLTVVARPNAQITLINAKSGVTADQDSIEGEASSIIFNELKPGLYRVTAKLEGYYLASGEEVVKKGQPSKIDLVLTPITYNVNIKLNDSIDGTIMYRQGNDAPRTIEIRDGLAVLPDLRSGKYEVMLRPDDAAYAPRDDTIEVSDTRLTHDFILKNRLSTGEFSGAAASDWDMPSGWQFASGMLRTGGPGLAWPQDKGKRHYKDFQLTAAVKMVNGVAASFAVHAEDSRNYYLVQLTGPKAVEPNVLRAFIVKDGVEQRFGQTHRIGHIAALKSEKPVLLNLSMKDNVIKVDVIDNETAEELPAGTFTDPNRTYPIGAVGVVVRKDEQMHVAQFTVSPQK